MNESTDPTKSTPEPMVKRVIGRLAVALARDPRRLQCTLSDPIVAEIIDGDEPARIALSNLVESGAALNLLLAREHVQRKVLALKQLSSLSDAAALLVQNHDLMLQLLAREEMIEVLESDQALIDRRIERPAINDRICQNPKILQSVFDDEDTVVGQVIRRRTIMDTLLSNPGMIHAAVANRQFLDKLFDDNSFWTAVLLENEPAHADQRFERPSIKDRICRNPDILRAIFDNENSVVSEVIRRRTMMDALLCKTEMIHAAVANRQFLDRLFDDNSFWDAVANLPKQIVKYPRKFRLITDNKQVLQWLIEDSELFHESIMQPELLGRLLTDDSIMQKLLWDQRVTGRIVGDAKLLKFLVSQDRALGRILADDVLLGKVLSSPRSLERIVSEPALLERIVTPARLLETALGDPRLIRSVLDSPEVQQWQLNDDEAMTRVLWDERTIGRILGDGKLLKYIVSRDKAIGRVISDASLLEKVLSSPRTLELIDGDETLRQRLVSSDRIRERVFADGSIMRSILDDPRTLRTLAHDTELATKLLWDEKIQRRITTTLPLLRTLVSHNRSVEIIVSNEQLLAKVLRHNKTRRLLEQNGDAHRATQQIPESERLSAPGSFSKEDFEQALIHEPWARSERLLERTEAVIEFDRQLQRLRGVMRSPTEQDEAKTRELRAGLTGIDDIPEAITDLFLDGDIAHFAGASMEIPDRGSFWNVLNEIMVNQEYYFETEGAEPRILDCGTHFGLAIYYFKTLFPRARISAFEPVPELREIAGRNVARNGWSDVEILPYAISDSNENAVFSISTNDSMAGSLTERRSEAGDNVKKIEVPCRKLSEYLHEPVHFLKLDIEGLEGRVLAEAEPLLGNVQNLFCEYHHGYGQTVGQLAEILAILDRAGFDAHVAKSYSSHQFTAQRPLSAVGSAYSAVIWARNLNWRPASPDHPRGSR